jgi:hypothetical protein
MRVRCLVLAVLAGCSFSHGTPATGDASGNGSDDAPPPVDAPVDTTMVSTDAPPDTPPPPPTDTDGDTIPDTTDNCPMVANTNQRDHDGDSHGDACDRCPHLASATDPDGDGDGVGDACDPRPTTAGDSIALFEGFYDASSIATWTATGNGTWSVANGVLTQSSTTTSATTNALVAPGTIARAAITSSAKVIALGNGTNGTNTPHVSVAAGVTQTQSYWCSVVDEGNSDKVYATTISGAAFAFPSVGWNGTFAANSIVQLTVALRGGNNVCTAVQNATSATVMGNTGTINGSVQVATRTASASFDYVFVVSIGN